SAEAGVPDWVIGGSQSGLALDRLLHDPAAIASAVAILAIALVAIFAPAIAALTGLGVYEQYPVTGRRPEGLPRPPSTRFLLGTDDLGRDLMVRIAYGTRISLLVGVAATLITVTIGSAVGMVAGFFGGLVDTVLARAVDVMLS